MNRPLVSPAVVAATATFAVVTLLPAMARAQTVSDASDDAGEVLDAAPVVDSGFPTVLPGPDAATTGVDGCDGKMVNAPCSLGVGAAGFCFPDGVDGSDEELECVVDSDVDPNAGCNLGASASSAGTVGGLGAFFGLCLVGISRAGRRRRR